jgi:hypothetical protein|tara:strand:- start:2174 stop:2569 length:396 start_codon:yes stop_codon:yes gene_type:complete
MKFQIQTLVDVTQTHARRHDDKTLVNQQANFNSLYNTIGLRTNPTEFTVTVVEENTKTYGFGKKYSGKHKIWIVDFEVEAEASTSVENMEEDFDLVPVIVDLHETAQLDKNMFVTSKKSTLTNVIFTRTDK